MLDVGEKPADFVLVDQNGAEVAWKSFRGRPVVVFCYPRASTPGCTTEACDYRDHSAAFASQGVAVVGLSPDAPKRQASFGIKYALTMPLLCDPDRKVLDPWGVFGEKKMYGKTVHGVIRTTFWFDADGRVVQRWSPVKVAGHAAAVLAAITKR